MSFIHKFSYEEKIGIITNYMNACYGFRESCRIYNISQSTLKNWLRLYKTFGSNGLRTGHQCSSYSAETKQRAVYDYLRNTLSIPEILIKYKIRSETQLRRWIMKYNGHKELKTSGTGGTTLMTKGRKTTYEERVEIIRYWIEPETNYAKSAEKYKVSYQQVYAWMKKYEADGISALVDRRGRAKPQEELSEVEKLRAENKLLKAENKRQEMEMAFLKKLEEIERWRF